MNNFKSLLVISTSISLVVGVGLSRNLRAETIWLEQEDFKTVAQGDKDDAPTKLNSTEKEIFVEEKETKKVVDEKKASTQEGDFLLPTYILPEAQGTAPQKVAAVDNQNPWRKPQPQESAPVKKTPRSGVALKGIAPVDLPQTSNGEKALLENIEKQYQTTAALLENTEKRLAALEKDLEVYSQDKADDNQSSNQENEENCEEEVSNDGKPQAPLLLPLAPIRTATEEEKTEQIVVEADQTATKKDYVDFILEAIERSKAKKFNPSQSDEMILRSIPKEMRISFLPGSADLSNQAFKWVKVFSYNPQRTVGSAVEVRLSPRDLDLQSRRFALIKGTLLSNGLTPRQIRFVFTDRDCDSVVLRDIQLPEEQEFLYQAGKNGKVSQQIIQKW